MSRNPIYVVVDTSRAAKCAWCKSIESKNWKSTTEGKLFCCSKCRDAYYCENRQYITIFMLVAGVVCLLIYLSDPESPNAFRVLFPSLMFLSFAVGTIPFIFIGYSHAKKVPQYSRRAILSAEHVFARRISNPIDCPNCMGKLDLSKIQREMVYCCEYCGATGAVEVVRQR